jgi:porphobilinogen deaminase
MSSNVLGSGMSGSQEVGTALRKSARLESKRGDVIVLDLPGTNLDERLRTTSRLEGDVVVLSVEKPPPT